MSITLETVSYFAGYLLGAAIAAYLLMLVWGFVLVPYGAPDFTYIQVCGLLVLVAAFGGAFRGWGNNK
jgi:hypothetical protein